MNMSMLWFKRFQYITRMMACALVACGITACVSMPAIVQWFTENPPKDVGT